MDENVLEQLLAFQRQLKSLQKQARTVIRFAAELEERIEASLADAQGPEEGPANDRTYDSAERIELSRR